MRATGGGLPSKPRSEIAEIVEEILGTANPSVCGLPDPARLKLKEIQICVDDAGAGPSDASSQDISLCPPDEPSASQDAGFDFESLKRKKLKLQINLLEIQNEYYA